MTKFPFRHSALVLALGLASLAPAAQALEIVFKDVGSTPMSAAQLAGFQTAASYWTSKLTDNVTVYIDIAFGNLGAGVLGGASPSFTSVDYTTLRSSLVQDASSAVDTSALAHLQAGPALAFLATQGDLGSRFDNDGSANNTLLGLTTANAKALGLVLDSPPTGADASIVFATGFASSFSYSRNGGTPAGQLDFITVAEHEIGHALGFTSGVDDIDGCAGAAPACAGLGLGTGADRFEGDWWYEPLDLFRYSAAGVLDLRVGGSPYLSIDGGASVVAALSTGEFNGDGYQASHFAPGQTNLMRAFVTYGTAYDASAADLTAFDAIGWNLAVAVPEPATYALWLLGLVALGGAARRRPSASA